MSSSLIIWITGVETIKRQTRAAYGCLVVGQSLWARAQKCHCSCGMRLVALRKCYMTLPMLTMFQGDECLSVE